MTRHLYALTPAWCGHRLERWESELAVQNIEEMTSHGDGECLLRVETEVDAGPAAR